MLSFFYIALSYLIIPFLIIRLWVKSIRQPAYRARINERLGFFKCRSIASTNIWLHAVSLGEVIAAAPLVEKLLEEYPNKTIILTTTTPTGSQKTQTLFAKAIQENRLFHVYSPFDAPCCIRHFLKKIQPQCAIMMETEIWPNWYAACKKNKIPLFIANARLSQRSQEGYNRIKTITSKALNCTESVLSQTQEDANRFMALGLPSDKSLVLGNIKFDLVVPADIHEKAKIFRSKLLAKDRHIWVAGSTHQGEEEIVLEAFKLIKETHTDAVLILVPRHPERFDKVAELSQKTGFNTILRTTVDTVSSEMLTKMDVLLGNTIGEMLLFLASSDVAFIGGSLIPQGGHNVLEPAALYLPVITGPNMFNFQKIYDEFTQAECIITVNDAASLAQSVSALFLDPALREEYASLGFKIIQQNQGALEKHLDAFRNYLT